MINKFQKILKYLLFKNKIKLPPFLIFFITSACNARCSHCFNWRNLNKSDDLSFEEIKKLSQELGHIDSLGLSGGEPFLRRDLPEICDLFFKKNKIKVLSIPTNGFASALIEEKAKKILKYSQGKKVIVGFSLDGTEKVHDQIRGVPGGFKRALDSCRRLKNLQQQYPNVIIAVNITVHNKNYKNLFKLIGLLKELPYDFDQFNFAFLRGLPRDKSYELPPRKELIKLHQHIKKVFAKNQSVVAQTIDDMIFEFKLKVLSQKDQPITCEAGRLIGVINANGDVRHCELLPPIGNLRKNSFQEIWHSKEAKIARKRIKDHQCYCTHECFIFPTLIAHPLFYHSFFLKLIKNWLYRFK